MSDQPELPRYVLEEGDDSHHVPYGPTPTHEMLKADDRFEGRPQLYVPSRFIATVIYQDAGMHMRLDCRFDGDRIVIPEITLRRPTGETLTPTDLISLRLQQVVAGMAPLFGEPIPDWTRGKGKYPAMTLDIARLYWNQHVFWGSPRAAIMEHFGIARTTANTRIRKAAQIYDLPGPHAQDAQELVTHQTPDIDAAKPAARSTIAYRRPTRTE